MADVALVHLRLPRKTVELTIEDAMLVPVKTTMLGAIKRSIVRLYKRIA